MGLTIHYSFKAGGTERYARTLVERLHTAAKEMPFKEVGDLIVFEGDGCDFEKLREDHPHRWLLIQAEKIVTVAPPEKRRDGRTYVHEVRVIPDKVIGFATWPGEGCEEANFGLCHFPAEILSPRYGRVKTKLRGWSWDSFCKTQYASDPRCGGMANFLRCHLAVVALLDVARRAGMVEHVNDEGDFWEKRSIQALAGEVGDLNQLIAAHVGLLKNLAGDGVRVEAPITAFSTFEHLEAAGHEKLPEVLRALAVGEWKSP